MFRFGLLDFNSIKELRLRVWLPSFINSNQSAFIPGRSIIENILLCQELFGLLIAIGTPLKFVSWIRACVTSPMFSIMINGSLEGFFHGRKGVRQGDPLSPFLFVMMMEVLSCMLNKIPQSFLFHHRCENVKLNHLTFADDLMIFCAADESSLRFIRECLQKFGELSGLFVNLTKNSMFVAGVNSEVASHLAASMGFVLGNLPVRYLGLPLLSGRLRSSDCAPLIQRITSRIRSWFARVFSFAGRLQLIRYVLRSLQVFWASVFVLPAYVHNKVDKILRSYLWRDKEEGRGGVKVAWVEVCLPFEEGGLAIRDGPSWNLASTLKILWLMLTNSGSLWVAWVEAYILKGRSLWEVDSRVGRSWCLRAILRKREKLKHQVRMEVRHGSTCRVWLDPWLQGGPILEQEVSPCISVRDRWVWVLGHQGGFSIASAWEAIRPRGGRVRWTGGIAQYRCRVFSVRGVWSLAITCSFRVRMGDVWSRVLRIMASSHRIGHWGVELSWICHRGIGKGVRRKLWRVLWCATIYYIWNERNHRLHGGQARHPIVIFHLICTWIRARAGSWREDANLPF
ncbi:putative reverse transcriptase [Cucumis melo var. makuwa]|uniref:Reverse transcriptase n=1 Tax=Cucumis melo var. makuwa TaxID=1194695 RepID=A0A5A7V2L9_CUCMM|nr:putative reverse transcriptase [Cucumis melo var. makuwa]